MKKRKKSRKLWDKICPDCGEYLYKEKIERYSKEITFSDDYLVCHGCGHREKIRNKKRYNKNIFVEI